MVGWPRCVSLVATWRRHDCQLALDSTAVHRLCMPRGMRDADHGVAVTCTQMNRTPQEILKEMAQTAPALVRHKLKPCQTEPEAAGCCSSADMLPRVDSSGAGSAPGDMASQSQPLPIADAPDDYGSSGSMPLFVRGGAGTETVMSRSHTEAPGAFPGAFSRRR